MRRYALYRVPVLVIVVNGCVGEHTSAWTSWSHLAFSGSALQIYLEHIQYVAFSGLIIQEVPPLILLS